MRGLSFVLAALPLLVACDGKVETRSIVALVHDEASVPMQNDTHVVPPPECAGPCCPKACVFPRDGAAYSGPECLAPRDNTDAQRWQLRQTMSVSTSPPGISSSLIANILVQRSELYSKECSTPSGTGGFIQLIDLDRRADVARVGFASYVKDEATALRDGLCFVEDTYFDPKWHLSTLYRPDWPKGLPPPLPQPWKVSVVRSARLRDRDFDLKTDREALLARFAPGADLASFGGVFYMDEKRGYMHGYAPLAFIVNYDSAISVNAIPIRETELTIQMNDPEHPNCVGSFLGDNPNLPSSCEGNSTNRSWGCYTGNCGPTELAPATVKGYFLVAEMEQVHIALGQTLCHLFPSGGPVPVPAWSGSESCREDPKWDPTDPVHGMPPGDFCAKTNDVATPECHDAFRSISYSTFQAFPIRDGTCPLK